MFQISSGELRSRTWQSAYGKEQDNSLII
jgi:hypothetical protein